MVDDYNDSPTVMGKILANRVFSYSMVVSTLKVAWSFLKEFTTKEMEPNTFLFRFSKQEDQEKVLATTPWNIRGNILVIKSWIHEPILLEVDFFSNAMWIQVHGFPWNRMGENTVQFIGLKLGRLLEVDKWEYNDQEHKPFFQLRVKLDHQKPLVGGFPIPRK